MKVYSTTGSRTLILLACLAQAAAVILFSIGNDTLISTLLLYVAIAATALLIFVSNGFKQTLVNLTVATLPGPILLCLTLLGVLAVQIGTKGFGAAPSALQLSQILYSPAVFFLAMLGIALPFSAAAIALKFAVKKLTNSPKN